MSTLAIFWAVYIFEMLTKLLLDPTEHEIMRHDKQLFNKFVIPEKIAEPDASAVEKGKEGEEGIDIAKDDDEDGLEDASEEVQG